MKKFLVMLLVLSMMVSMVACGNKGAGKKESENGETVAGTEVVEITAEEAKTCLYLANESWMCDMFGDSIEHGSEVSAKIFADYYISEADDAAYDVKSVSVRHVKFGNQEIIPVQTGSSEKAAEMLKSLGYGESENLTIVGEPHVVFHFESELSGVYNDEDWSINIPYEISCNVVFENGQEVVVDFAYDVTGVGSGGYTSLNEASFKDFQ